MAWCVTADVRCRHRNTTSHFQGLPNGIFRGFSVLVLSCFIVLFVLPESNNTKSPKPQEMLSLTCCSCFVFKICESFSPMGWLRSVGSTKLYVSFAEYRLFYRALLQKRPINLSILLTEATPDFFFNRSQLFHMHIIM